MNFWRTKFQAEGTGEIFFSDECTKFNIDNTPLTLNEYSFICKGEFECEKYTVIEYSAFGIIRDHEFHAPLITGEADGEKTTLFELNDTIIDNKKHRIVIENASAKKYTDLKLRFSVKAPRANFTLYKLYSCSFDELPARFEEAAVQEKKSGFTMLSLDGKFNSKISDTPEKADGGRGFPSGETVLCGIPFLFSSSELNQISPDLPPKENDDIISNFGVKAKRRVCRPTSRDDKIIISADARTAKEIIFTAAISGNVYERWGFCKKDPTILGSANGEVMMPIQVNDVERFLVEIVYENGLRDTAFPYNVMQKRHVMSGEVGIYAVPANNYPIKEIIFHGRMIDTDVSISAVTLNESGENVIPPKPKKRETVIPQTKRGKFITQNGDIIEIVSDTAKMVLSTKGGLRIVSFENDYAPKSSVCGQLLKLRLPDETLASDFETEVISIKGTEAKILCRHPLITCTATISAKGNGELGFELSAVNENENEVSCGILYPVLDNVLFADTEDSWYMFPKYQNILSNGQACIYEESAPTFPMQFFDLFSYSQSAGVGLLTKEKELTVRKYALEKDERAINAYVEYPAMYMKLGKGETFEASSAEIFVHAGTWRFAYNKYREWLKTWYSPYKCQNKTWYRSKFWLMAEITDFYETKDFTHLPVWYDKENKEYAFKCIMDEQKSLYGEYPDILHMWSWTYDEKLGHSLWGHYDKEDYDRIGGLDNFIGALHDCTDKTGVAISLYLHPTLLTNVYPEAKKYMPDLYVKRKNGIPISLYGDTFRMCHAEDCWKERTLKMYQRVYKDTGIKILYVDEFSLGVKNRCYNEKHSHPIPSNLLKTDREFISALREVMPEEVVLYGEYAAVDVNARYIDCNISYHILDSIRDILETSWHYDDGDDSYGRVFTDLYRFAFPKIVQLVLPMAMRFLSWQPLKSTFFNGETIYDSFWDSEESRGRAFMAKSFKIKKKYSDCFTCDTPDTMLESLLDGVYINRFDGDGRVLFNIYNSAYETRRGVLLELPYECGVTYYDVWNDYPCKTQKCGDKIRILCNIGAQEVGCIVAEKTK